MTQSEILSYASLYLSNQILKEQNILDVEPHNSDSKAMLKFYKAAKEDVQKLLKIELTKSKFFEKYKIKGVNQNDN